MIQAIFLDLNSIGIYEFTGKAGVDCYTQIKTVTQKRKDSDSGSKINMVMRTSQNNEYEVFIASETFVFFNKIKFKVSPVMCYLYIFNFLSHLIPLIWY